MNRTEIVLSFWLRSRNPRNMNLLVKYRVLIYLMTLVVFSYFFADYANIDLLSFWQEGHGFMLGLTMLTTAFFIHTLCGIRYVGGVLFALWVLICVVQVRVLEMMNFRVSFGILSNVFETDMAEAGSFLSSGVLLGGGLLLLVSFCFWWGMRRLLVGESKKSLYIWGVLFLATLANFIFVPEGKARRETALWPLNNLDYLGTQIGKYWFQERPMMQALKELPSTSIPESSFTPPSGGITVVIHFGETVRADHCSIDGYHRETTPFAQTAQTEGRLVNFPHTLSYAAGTRLGAIGLLTPATIQNHYPAYGAVFDLFQKHGFSLQGFRSNQQADDQVYDSTLITLTKLLKDKTFYSRDPAISLIPAVKSYLEEEKNPCKMIFYYGEGSHAPYLYTSEFAKFVPDNMDIQSPGKRPVDLVNRYDNAIFATDQFIKQMTSLMEDSCAVYLYTADHGEYLGEHGHFSHGINTMCDPEIRFVPLYVWFSPKYEQVYPEKVACLKKNAQKLPYISHDYYFHTALGMAGIKSKVYNPQLDLTSEQCVPYTGPQPQDVPKDYVFDSLSK